MALIAASVSRAAVLPASAATTASGWPVPSAAAPAAISAGSSASSGTITASRYDRALFPWM
jgi:hypothetical protein